MTETSPGTRSDGQDQKELRFCLLPDCRKPFTPVRESQKFCKDKCRLAYNKDYGQAGRVVSVRKLKGGMSSVVIHTQNAGQLEPGKIVQVVP